MNSNTDGQGKRPCRRNWRIPRQKAGIYYTDCHSLRYIVQRYSQNHHRSTAQIALWALSLLTSHMQMGNQVVKQEQKQYTNPKADKRREKGQPSHAFGLLDSRNQQAPDRRCNHYTSSKASKRALHHITKRFFHKEHTRRTECCSDKRYQYADKSLHYFTILV